MNNVEDSSGTKESHVKLIRAESIGTRAWQGSDSSTAHNNWTTGALQKYLNSETYWSNTLTSTSKEQISNIKWNLGGHNTASTLTSTLYTAERGTTVYSGNPTTKV